MDRVTYPNGRRTPRVARRLPPAQPAPGPAVVPPVGPVRSLAASSHLVLLNGAQEHPDSLLGVAGHLARRAGAAVRVAYLQAPPPWGDAGNIRPLTPAPDRRPPAEIFDRLLGASRDLTTRAGVPARPEMLIGPPEPTLSGYVAADQYDLVTLAAGGHWPPLWVGGLWSVAARWRPVLVVGPKVSPAWGTGPDFSGEVVAVLDGTAAAETILAPAVGLCRLLGGPLTLLRAARLPATDEDRRYLADLGERLQDAVPVVRTVVTAGPPAEAVLGVQKSTGAVVALAAPTRRWLTAMTPGRVAVRLLREATSPLLYYRPTP